MHGLKLAMAFAAGALCGMIMQTPAIPSASDPDRDATAGEVSNGIHPASGIAGGPNANCPADIVPLPDGNGIVNLQDLLAVIGAWGACPPAPCDSSGTWVNSVAPSYSCAL